MEHKEHDRVLAFDTLFTTNHIRMLKIVMPFFDISLQRHMAVYIKYLELQYTLSYFKRYSLPPFSGSLDKHSLCDDILPFCSTEEKSKIEQLKNIFSTFENYQNMMEMMSMMKEMSPDFGANFDPNMMSGLFGGSGDVGGMFDMFQMFQGDNNSGNT